MLRRSNTDPPKLTPREIQLRELLLSPKGIKTIAYEMGVSVSTAKTSCHLIYRKLGYTSRVELMSLAIASLANELAERPATYETQGAD